MWLPAAGDAEGLDGGAFMACAEQSGVVLAVGRCDGQVEGSRDGVVLSKRTNAEERGGNDGGCELHFEGCEEDGIDGLRIIEMV